MMRFKAGLAIALAIAAAPSSAAWLEARTDHFIVYSEGSEASVRSYAAKLERFDQGMRRIHALPDSELDRANPLIVFALSDSAAIHRLYCGAFSQVKERAGCREIAGFYAGHVEGSVAFTSRDNNGGGKFDLSALTTLLHEYSHHMMSANYAGVYPAWYVEGFAEFNSTASLDKPEGVGIGLPATHRAYGLFLGSKLPIEKLLASNISSLKGEERESLYGRGWLLTHMLTFEKARSGQLDAYIAAMNRGVPSLEAARAAFGDLAKLNKEMDAYVRRKSMSYVMVSVSTVPDSLVKIRRLTSGESAMMPIRIQSDRGVDGTTAGPVALEARRLAQPFADDPGAQLALTEAEFDAGNLDLAEAAADRVLAKKPDDYGALLYKGQIEMRRAWTANARDDATWKKVRSWFVRANRQQNNAAEALWLFYISYRSQAIKPTTNAVAGLERAFQLVPQDDGVRFTLAGQYLSDGRLVEARKALVPLAYDPHAAPDNRALKLIELIDKGDRTKIDALLSGKADDDRGATD